MSRIKAKNGLAALLTLVVFGCAQGQGIKFEKESWQELKNKAKTENKLVFVDAYTTWCGPCRLMDKNVFSNMEVGNFYNSNFIPFKIDAEKGEGLKLAEEYNIDSFPTYLFVDGEGTLISRKTGAMEVQALLQLGQRVLDLGEETKKMELAYRQGNRDPGFIVKYMALLKEKGLSTEEVALWYFAMIGQENWTAYENLRIAEAYLNSPYSQVVEFLAHKKEPIEIARRGGAVYFVLYGIYDNYIKGALRKGGDRDQELRELVSDLDAVFYPQEAAYFKFLVEKEILKRDQDWEDYTEVIIAYGNNHLLKEKAYSDLNNWAMALYNNGNITDEHALEESLKWMAFVIGEHKTTHPYYGTFLDTQARILYKLGRKKEALKVANMAKDSGYDPTETEQLLKQIKAGPWEEQVLLQE